MAGCGSPTSSIPAAPDTTSATPAITASAAPQTLLDLQGSGSKSSQTFTAKKDWDLAWTYDCSSRGEGNFVVDVVNAADNTQSYVNQGINQLGAKGSGVEHYHSGGSFYLKVVVGCNWTLKATG